MTAMDTQVAYTEDGYRLVKQPNGTWTNGDMTFESLDQILDAVDASIKTETVELTVRCDEEIYW